MQERALAPFVRWIVLSLPAERGNHENAKPQLSKRMTPLFDLPKSRAEMECLQIQTGTKRAARGSLLRAGEACISFD
jgi:hypothetical protein